MSGSETWSEDSHYGDTVADPVPETDAATSEPASRGRLGRSTCLPRLEREEGEAPTIVKSQEARYHGLEELGRGGLGVVLGARDRDIGRRVAIKQLRDDRRSNKALLRFAEEVRTVGKLDHPNIVPIHDVGADPEGNPYFVMKYVQGQTLADVIETLKSGDAEAQAHWTWARRMEVFRKVLDAVGFAHDAGIVHRDLKPENIMIGTHGEVHVLDWGIARRDASPDLSGVEGDDPIEERVTQTRVGAVMGTPAYMSPEQARGDTIDARSDIYSLGVVLSEWLTLNHYLDDVHDIDGLLDGVQNRLIEHPMTQTTVNLETVPADLGWMVMRATNKELDARYPSIEAWLDALDANANGDVAVACPFTFQKRVITTAERTLDRHPFLWTAAAVGAMVASLGILGVSLSAAFVAGVVFSAALI